MTTEEVHSRDFQRQTTPRLTTRHVATFEAQQLRSNLSTWKTHDLFRGELMARSLDLMPSMRCRIFEKPLATRVPDGSRRVSVHKQCGSADVRAKIIKFDFVSPRLPLVASWIESGLIVRIASDSSDSTTWWGHTCGQGHVEDFISRSRPVHPDLSICA